MKLRFSHGKPHLPRKGAAQVSFFLFIVLAPERNTMSTLDAHVSWGVLGLVACSTGFLSLPALGHQPRNAVPMDDHRVTEPYWVGRSRVPEGQLHGGPLSHERNSGKAFPERRKS